MDIEHVKAAMKDLGVKPLLIENITLEETALIRPLCNRVIEDSARIERLEEIVESLRERIGEMESSKCSCRECR